MRVALVKCAVLPEPDPDEAPLLAALRARGADARTLDWDGGGAGDPSSFDVCVLRATWNSHLHPGRFLSWCAWAARESRLMNSAGLVGWNLDKGYLRELGLAGLPVVPTLWIDGSGCAGLVDELERRGWRDVVIKPRVGAASYMTRRFRGDRLSEAAAFASIAAGEHGAMAQPFVSSVESAGERSIVWIDGAVTHAVRKRPRFEDEEERVDGPLVPTEAERELVGRAIAALPERPTYARIDLFDAPEGSSGRASGAVGDGALWISELELIEPSLFFRQGPEACERLADAIVGAARA